MANDPTLHPPHDVNRGVQVDYQGIAAREAARAAYAIEALRKVASECPDSEWTRERLEQALVFTYDTAENALDHLNEHDRHPARLAGAHQRDVNTNTRRARSSLWSPADA